MVTMLTLSHGRSSHGRIGWHVSSESSLLGGIFACRSRAVAPGRRLLSCCGSGANGAYAMLRLTRSATLYLREWARRTVSVGRRPFRLISAHCLPKKALANTLPEIVLNIKEVHFAVEIITVIEHGKRNHLSIVRFTQERGAASSFHKVVETVDSVFTSRGLLVQDSRKAKMMIKTLNS